MEWNERTTLDSKSKRLSSLKNDTNSKKLK